MALSKTTKDHDEIKQWAESRGAVPGEVASTEGNGGPGILRFMFPKAPYHNDGALKEIEWDDFFGKFDASGLELIYQDVTAEGAESNFNKLIYPENESVSVKKSAGKKAAKKTAAKSGARKAVGTSALKKSPPAKKYAAKKAIPAKKSATKTSSRQPAAKTAAGKTAVKKGAANKPAPVKKAQAIKSTGKKSAAKSIPAKKTAAKKGVSRGLWANAG